MSEHQWDGVILSRTGLRERDLICRLLLRNGQKVSAVFYGGRGGGKKQKSPNLEYGHLIQFVPHISRRNRSDLVTVKEHKLKWQPSQIRLNHRAFYSMCFYLETVDKIAMNYDPHAQASTLKGEDDGLFRVLSNALYYLEESLKKQDFIWSTHCQIFLSKLIFETGIAPDTRHCHFCEKNLVNTDQPKLLFEHGGFACYRCFHSHATDLSNQAGGEQLWEHLRMIYSLKYADYHRLKVEKSTPLQSMFSFFCYQHQLDKQHIKSFHGLC